MERQGVRGSGRLAVGGGPWWGLNRIAALSLTLVLLAALVVVAGVWSLGVPEWVVTLLLSLIGLNLLAFVLVHPGMRGRFGLWVFHLCLLVVLLLVAWGRMTYLKGEVELATGGTFAPDRLQKVEQGPWHDHDLDRVRFTLEEFKVFYRPGLRRGRTEAVVRWNDEAGAEHRAVIGDHRALVMRGYRFYTTANKGFAPVFSWQSPGGGDPTLGVVHLASFPMTTVPSSLWTIPATGKSVLTLLRIDSPLLDLDHDWVLTLPERHHLVVTLDGETREMRPGERWSMADGVLGYERLIGWMGLRIFRDETLPWLVSACVLAIWGLFSHLISTNRQP